MGFPWKQILGITNARRKIAKATGIPTTKAGRREKMKRIVGAPAWWLLTRRRTAPAPKVVVVKTVPVDAPADAGARQPAPEREAAAHRPARTAASAAPTEAKAPQSAAEREAATARAARIEARAKWLSDTFGERGLAALLFLTVAAILAAAGAGALGCCCWAIPWKVQ